MASRDLSSRAAGPWGAAAGWTVGIGALAAELWLCAYSYPEPSLIVELPAAVLTAGTVIAAIGWAVTHVRLSATPPGDGAAATGGPAVGAATVLLVMAVAVFGLCAVRAPMWVRLGEAAPQMLWLAHRAQPQSLTGSLAPAWAGSYHFSNVYRSPSGYVEFASTISGLLQTASYVYSPSGDPGSLDRKAGSAADDGVRYRHLVGPWWAATSDVPGA